MAAIPLIAGIELGGTKINCVLARGPDEILEEVQLPTMASDETLAAVETVLDRWRGFVALGIASFGPIGIDPFAEGYGHITVTTKPGWENTDVAGRLARHTGVPTGLHTDVVGAALSEARWGAAEGIADLAYITVGTGIGVGLIAAGKPVEGFTHSELGHVRSSRIAGDIWPGICPFHGDCVEGLASGTAIAARVGKRAETLGADDPAWDAVAHALGQLLHTLVLTGVPRRIVMGGGVMVGTPSLFPRVRAAMMKCLGGYIPLLDAAHIDDYVVPPKLGNRAGPLGAIVLGERALEATGQTL